MPTSIVVTVGGASSNSYITLADADTYFTTDLTQQLGHPPQKLIKL